MQPDDELGLDDPVARVRRLPPAPDDRSAPADVVSGFEGVPARFGVSRHYELVGRYEVTVWAFFGRARPTAAQLRAANAELAAARLPR